MATTEIRQIIPVSGKVSAHFMNKDGTTEDYPIVCWCLEIEHFDEEEQKEWGAKQFEYVKGMIFEEGGTSLTCVSDYPEFACYLYLD